MLFSVRVPSFVRAASGKSGKSLVVNDAYAGDNVKISVENEVEHDFVSHTFLMPTSCDQCGKFIVFGSKCSSMLVLLMRGKRDFRNWRILQRYCVHTETYPVRGFTVPIACLPFWFPVTKKVFMSHIIFCMLLA